MNKTFTLTFSALTLALSAGCNVDVSETPEAEDIGSGSEAIYCNNDAATAAIQAGMAVAAAKELRRFNPRRDIGCIAPSWMNMQGTDLTGDGGLPDGVVDQPGKCLDVATDGQFKIKLTTKGNARCSQVSAGCRNLKALFKLQNDSSAGMVFGGQVLAPDVLRSRIFADWQDQFVCINRPDNGFADNCPIENHDLVYLYKNTSSATCDNGFDFWFKAWKMGSTTVPLTKPAQLKNLLMWAGYPENPFLAFTNNGSDIKIDPTGGTAEGSSTTSGSCTVVSYNASANRCGSVYSATNLIGSCCQCNGVNKTFVAGAQTDYYKCQ